MKFTKILAAVAVSAAFIAPASADTIGMADLAITGLFIQDRQGAFVTTDIQVDSETRGGNATASYNGVDAVGTGSGNISSTTIGAVVDVAFRCAGPSCGAAHANTNYNGGVINGPASKYENDISTHLGTATGNYALADMYIAGSAVAINGANGLTRADSAVTNPSNNGSANATILNTATAITKFTALTTLDARFGVSYDAYVAALVNVMAGVKGNASGKISWSLDLTELGTADDLLNWAPSELNKGRTSSRPSQNIASYSSAGTIFSNFVTLTAGREYALVINQASNSLAREVPEPGSMMLVALGLFAVGAASRRKAGK